MDDIVKYWTELSDYDLETAEAMLESKRFLYVGFMCHQTIEKVFKAYYFSKKKETIPFSHSLSYLASKGGFYEEFSESQKDFIDQVEPLNIEARYPSDKDMILKSLSETRCREIIDNTTELHEWIKAKL